MEVWAWGLWSWVEDSRDYRRASGDVGVAHGARAVARLRLIHSPQGKAPVCDLQHNLDRRSQDVQRPWPLKPYKVTRAVYSIPISQCFDSTETVM